ncbi:MAG: NlpC/P60 family protein [Thermoleophilia bacterium]
MPAQPATTSATSATAAPMGTTGAATGQPTILSDDAFTEVNRLSDQADGVQAEIDDLDADLERRVEAYNQLMVQLDRTNQKLKTLREQLKRTETEHATRAQALNERLRGIYKSGGRDSLLPMLFAADGVGDLHNHVRLISQLVDQDNVLIETLHASSEQLKALLADVDDQKQEELSLRQRLADEREQIEARLLVRKAVLADINADISAIVAEDQKRQAAEIERARQAPTGFAGGGQTYTSLLPGPLPQNGDIVLDQLVETATYYLGIPYVWAGSKPSTGFDCSGFTQYVYAQHGIQLPHYSGYQAQMGTPIDPADIKAGDLLAFGFPVHHVGIYINNDQFIHAPRTGDVIKISTLSERSDLATIRRFPLKLRTEAPAVR